MLKMPHREKQMSAKVLAPNNPTWLRAQASICRALAQDVASSETKRCPLVIAEDEADADHLECEAVVARAVA